MKHRGWQVRLLVVALAAVPCPGTFGGDSADPTEPDLPQRPVNLDLELGDVGGVPAGWLSRESNAEFGYTVELVDERPHSGSRCGRISRSAPPDFRGFGNLMQGIDAAAYRGRRIRLSAAIRAEVTDARSGAQMWLRVDRPAGGRGFFDNMDGRAVRSAEWATYSTVGDVAADAAKIFFGVFLTGAGRAWADDFSLEIVGDTGEGDRAPAPLAGRALDNLVAFTRLLGYVRHFHPDRRVAAADWERLAILGTDAVEDAASPAALAAALRSLLAPVAPLAQVLVTGEDPPLPAGLLRPAGEVPARAAWLHYGLGVAGSRSIYSSRIATLDGGPGQNEAGLVHAVDAAPYRGKRIRFRAAARAEVPPGGHHAALAVQVFTPGGVAFEEQMDDDPITSAEWTTYEIVGEVAEDAHTIYLAIGLAGRGQGWFDEVEFGPAESWERDRVRFDFSGTDKGQNPEGWQLMASGPNVEYGSGMTDDGCGPRERCATVRGAAQATDYPDPDEPFRADLGGGVSCRVPLTLWDGGSDPPAAPAVVAGWPGRPPAWTPSGNDRSTRLAVVALSWNVFQHFYPYFDQIETDWDGALRAALDGAARAADDRAFLDVLRVMVAALHDGHGRVNHGSESPQLALPLCLDWVEEQLVITAVGAEATAGLSPGDVVLAIDGVSAERAVERAERLISGSPQWRRRRAVDELGWGTAGEGAVLRVRTVAGEEREVRLVHSLPPWGEGALHEERPETVAELAPGMFYVDLDRVTREELDGALERLAAARGVVFDLRGYPRHVFGAPIQHLIDEPVSSAQWHVPVPRQPDRRRMEFQFSNWALQPESPRIRGRVAFVTDSRAISAAETVLGIVEHYRLAEIVGSRTAGTNGNVNPFSVAGYSFIWTGMRVLKHDGSRHHGLGIQPTLPVRRTVAGIAAGRDELLEAALDAVRATSAAERDAARAVSPVAESP